MKTKKWAGNITITGCFILLGAPSVCAEVMDDNEMVLLPDVLVEGKRLPSDLYGANHMTLSREALDKSAANDLKSMVRYVPGVSAANDSSNPAGGQGFRIRGVDGNRVSMSIDGDKLPESYAYGHDAAYGAGRDFVEFDTLKRVDIQKTPDSSRPALAGGVNYRTYSPEDFVGEDKPWYGEVKYGFNGANHGHKTTLTGALYQGGFAALMMATKTQYQENKNMGNIDGFKSTNTRNQASRTLPNPLDGKNYNLLTKLTWQGDTQHLALTYERFKRDAIMQDYYKMSSVQDLDEKQNILQRERVAVDYQHDLDLPWIDQLNFRAYVNNSQTEENKRWTLFDPNKIYQQQNTFDQKIKGIRVDAKKQMDWLGAKHDVVMGLDMNQSDTKRLVYANRQIGDKSRLKNQPDTRIQELGLFWEDSVTFADGWLVKVGFNFNQQQMKTSPDKDYLNNINIPNHYLKSIKQHDKTWLPSIKLAKNFWSDKAQVFLDYSQGVRYPAYENLGTTDKHGSNRPIVPNYDLKKERSDNVTLGYRYDGDKNHYGISGFYTLYHDFIRTGDVNKPNGEKITASYNKGQVKIYGIEAYIKQNIWESLYLNGSLAWMKSKDKETGKPLIHDIMQHERVGVDPFTFVLGLSYEAEKWRASIDWTHKNATQYQYGAKDSPYFRSFDLPHYNIVDASASWQVNKHLHLNAGVYNIGNKKYWDGIDMTNENNSSYQGMFQHKSFIDRWTQPGRIYAVGAKYVF